MADVVLDLYAEDLDKDFAGQAQVSHRKGRSLLAGRVCMYTLGWIDVRKKNVRGWNATYQGI